MTGELTPDEIRGALRDYFADRPGPQAARRVRDAAGTGDEPVRLGFEPSGWLALADQLGLAGMAVPEHLGGLGLGLCHVAAAVEECGVGLAPEPVRAAGLLSWALRGLPPERAEGDPGDAIGRFLAGDAVPGTPISEGLDDLPECSSGAATGRISAVTHGAAAELVLTPVRTPDGLAVALVLAGPGQAGRSGLSTVDFTAPVADVAVESAPTVLLSTPGDEEALQRHLTVARVLLAAEQVGGAEGCLAGMVDYAKVRAQFGQLIGSYQAIQHHCATTAVDVAAARALVGAAAAAVDSGDLASAHQLGLLARAEAADAFTDATSTYIQVSGGIGFTWEHDAHLFFRRARASAYVAGTPEEHRHRAVAAGCLDLLLAAS